jgi:hypothetical protein
VHELDVDALRASKWFYTEGYLVTSDTARVAAIEARKAAEHAGVKTPCPCPTPTWSSSSRTG